MNITRTPFTTTRGGLTIRGYEYRGERENPPAVILSHGFLATQKTVTHYAKQFAMWGYAAYSFDFIGGGIGGKSDGRLRDMSVLTEKEDLLAVIRYVRQLPDVDASRLTLLGCSQGGFVSALVAAEQKEQVSELILFYPALCIPDDARAGKMIMFSFDPSAIPDVIGAGPLKLGRRYPEDVIGMDAFAQIAGYPGPVLIVHGAADQIVNVSYARRAEEAYRAARAEDPSAAGPVRLVVIGQAGHGFKKREDQTALKAVRAFLHRGSAL